ncbi:acylneuraminate cytidylyltransferase [Salinibacterium sp.]|uniref:acylneuraminate cytidylyltransferase n=2 Tax=Salinibacterium sp. TaxID=1915057 RepID=UPI00286B7CDC|nr:acylneuraminate cytidylyltransferase [Salinibacterium sp.]
MITLSSDAGPTRVIAIIPARGGSKGVPGKNLKTVGGVSLIGRAVASAQAADRIDEVFVSTDDAAIASAARSAGAQVIDRPESLAGDESSSEAALLHALDQLDEQPGILVFIQATSPFIDPADLDSAVSRVLSGEADVVFAARETHAFLWRRSAEGAVGVNHDASIRLRRQDAEPQFQETGAFYVMRVPGFRAAGFRFFGRVDLAVVPDLTSLEIDTLDDLTLARAIAPLVALPEPIDVDAVVTDFDGVHTNDRVHVGADGTEFVTASRSDGMGVELLRRAGLPILIISTETNPVVTVRARKLKVEVRQAVNDKASVLSGWAVEHNLNLDRVAYVGNDINDLACMALVGWPIAVVDAHPEVIAAARVVLSKRGGDGAIRELAERILARSEPLDPTLEELWSQSAHTS